MKGWFRGGFSSTLDRVGDTWPKYNTFREDERNAKSRLSLQNRMMGSRDTFTDNLLGLELFFCRIFASVWFPVRPKTGYPLENMLIRAGYCPLEKVDPLLISSASLKGSQLLPPHLGMVKLEGPPKRCIHMPLPGASSKDCGFQFQRLEASFPLAACIRPAHLESRACCFWRQHGYM